MGDRSSPMSPGGERYSPQRSYTQSRSRSPDGRGRSYTPDRDDKVSTIYVGGISFDTDERALQNYFSKFGTVTEVKVVIDRETGRSKGYGFVKFDDSRDAEDAIQGSHGKLLDGRTIRCNMARYNPRPGYGPGDRGNFGGGGGFDRGGGGYDRGFDGPSGPHGGRGFGGPPFGGRGDGGFRGRGGPPGRFGGPPMRPPQGFMRGGMSGGGGPPPMGPMGGMGGPPPNGFPHDQYGGPPTGMRSRSRSFSPPTRARHHKRRRSPSRSASDVVAEGKRSSKRSSKRPSRKQRYSSTPSGSSYTASSSGSETDRSRSPARRKKAAAPPPAAPAAKAAPVVDTATVAELSQVKAAKSELDSRVAALEAQLQAAAVARAASEAKEADLVQALEKQSASLKAYKKWFKALLESSQALVDGRNEAADLDKELKLREKDLQVLVSEATAFVDEQRTSRRERRSNRRPNEGGAIEGEEPSQAEPAAAEGAINGVADADPPLPPQEEAGGWSAVQDAGNGAASDSTAARFAPGAKFVVNTA